MTIEDLQARLARDLAAPQRREAKARVLDRAARTVEIAVSSEYAVERWYGIEILSHQSGAVRLGRMNDGAAALLGHDHAECIGVIVAGSARLDPDRVLRATAQITRNPIGDELLTDLEDGIRAKVSVGYMIHGYEVTRGESGAPDTIRATDWEPYEASFVAVPADPTVGAGRSMPEARGGLNADIHREDRTMTKQTQDGADDQAARDAAAAEAARAQAAADAKAAERAKEIERIREIGRQYGQTDLAEQFVGLERTASEFQARIATLLGTPQPIEFRSNATFEHRLRYRSLRGFSGEKAEETAYRMGQWARATLLGDMRSQQWCAAHNVRVMTGAAISKGGAVVPEEMSQAIIDLREEYGIARRLCRVVPMASDSMTIPRRVGGVTAYFVGEEDAVTASDKSWDIVTLTARKLAALTRFSTDYAEDAVIDVAVDLAQEMAYAFAVKEDNCLINGDGTSTYGHIYGVRPKIINGSYTAGAKDAASNHDTFAEIDADDLATVMAALPIYAQRMAKWIVSQPGNALVFGALAQAAGGNTMVDLGNGPRLSYMGYPIELTQAMPTSTGDLSNVAMILFGDLSQAATLGDRRGFTVKVLQERYAEYDQIGILGTERFDIVVHDLGDTSTAGPVVALIGE